MTYIILGQSVTAIKLIEQIRAQDQQAEVHMVVFDACLPAFPERFFELISRQVQKKEVVYQDENFYRNLRVEFITDKKITRINFNRKTIFFDDKSRLTGDVLIIAGAEKDAFPDVKGISKDGVFSLRTYSQVNAFLALVNRVDTIVIESEALSGVMLAQALMKQDKEVILCIPAGRIASERINAVCSDFLILLLENIGVRVIRGGSIREILGENDVKAVRLSVGKVIAAEIMIFPDALADMRFYAKSGLNVQEGKIVLDSNRKTGIECVFALDTESWETFLTGDPESIRQDQVGRVIAALHQSDYQPAVHDVESLQFEVSGRLISIIGNVTDSDADIFVSRAETGSLEKLIVLKNNVVQGAFLVDNSNSVQECLEMMRLKQAVDVAHSGFLSGCAPEDNRVEDLQVVEQQAVGLECHTGESGQDEGFNSEDFKTAEK